MPALFLCLDILGVLLRTDNLLVIFHLLLPLSWTIIPQIHKEYPKKTQKDAYKGCYKPSKHYNKSCVHFHENYSMVSVMFG